MAGKAAEKIRCVPEPLYVLLLLFWPKHQEPIGPFQAPGEDIQPQGLCSIREDFLWRNAEAVADQFQGVEPDCGSLCFNSLDGRLCDADLFGEIFLGLASAQHSEILRQIF